jgi:glycosyl transferase, family 25
MVDLCSTVNEAAVLASSGIVLGMVISSSLYWSIPTMAPEGTTSIKVISLDRSIDRRQAFTQMAGGTELDWAFFPARTGITEPLQYDDRVAVRRWGRALSSAEIGCYSSHFKVWEWLANSDYDQAIILEDDVIVDWAIIEKLAINRFSDYRIHLLRLHISYPFKCDIVKYRLFSPTTHLVRIVGNVPGAVAYLLTRTAARILVANYSTVAAPLDWVLARYWEHRIIGYCMFPFPVIERHGPSTIGDERHAASQRTLYERIARIGWRIRGRAQRAYVERCLIERHPLGPTKDSGPPFLPSNPPPRDQSTCERRLCG